MSAWSDRALAFAGICQAALAVQQLARKGEMSPETLAEPLYNSLLMVNADNTESVYGSRSVLAPGLKVLQGQLNGNDAKDVEQTQYVVRMLQLERLLMKNTEALKKLGSGIDQIVRQKNEFNFEHYRIVENLAGLYSDVISPLGPRIQVHGNPNLLKQPHIQHQIRALLLAGVRSAVLWRQRGGKRRQIIFSRSKILQATQMLLADTVA